MLTPLHGVDLLGRGLRCALEVPDLRAWPVQGSRGRKSKEKRSTEYMEQKKAHWSLDYVAAGAEKPLITLLQ